MEWLERGFLFEQNAVRFVLWKYGRHRLLVVECGLKRPPAAANVMRTKFTPNQMGHVKGKNRQEQIRLIPHFLPVIDWA